MRRSLQLVGVLAAHVACGPIDAAGDDVAESVDGLTKAFHVAPTGCAMAHCDARMSDQIGRDAPTGDIRTRWHDTTTAGCNIGLGCASNGERAACSYRGIGREHLVVYDDAGRLWGTKLLDASSWTSAPMIDVSGGVIAADSTKIVRFDPDGVVLWATPTPFGFPISPVITADGVVVLATAGGPISAYRSSTGGFLGQLELGYDTINTPAVASLSDVPGVSGDRVYVSTARGQLDAKLVAVDIRPDESAALVTAWESFHYKPDSGASPLVIRDRIYFDGHKGALVRKPYVFCIRDEGDHMSLVWEYPMQGAVHASLAQDPRTGVWTFGGIRPDLIRLSEDDGSEIERIDIDALIDVPLATYYPSSVMSLASDETNPVMIVSARPLNVLRPSYVLAIDLNRRTLLWKYRIAVAAVDWTAAQFVIIGDESDPLVVFPTFWSGARAIGR